MKCEQCSDLVKEPSSPRHQKEGAGRSSLPCVLLLGVGGGTHRPKSNMVHFSPYLLLLLWALVRKMASTHHPILEP